MFGESNFGSVRVPLADSVHLFGINVFSQETGSTVHLLISFDSAWRHFISLIVALAAGYVSLAPDAKKSLQDSSLNLVMAHHGSTVRVAYTYIYTLVSTRNISSVVRSALSTFMVTNIQNINCKCYTVAALFLPGGRVMKWQVVCRQTGVVVLGMWRTQQITQTQITARIIGKHQVTITADDVNKIKVNEDKHDKVTNIHITMDYIELLSCNLVVFQTFYVESSDTYTVQAEDFPGYHYLSSGSQARVRLMDSTHQYEGKQEFSSKQTHQTQLCLTMNKQAKHFI